VFPANLTLAETAVREHPATRPLDLPIEDFLGNHNCDLKL